jgi:hypothetical protein
LDLQKQASKYYWYQVYWTNLSQPEDAGLLNRQTLTAGNLGFNCNGSATESFHSVALS